MADLLRPTEIKPLEHSVFESLSGSDILLPDEILEEILALPRDSAMEDLVTVIQKTVFELENDEENWADYFSVIHALVLLAHFRAEEKLPFILDFFREERELLSALIGDFLTEELFMVFYFCGQNQIQALTSYVKDFSADNIYSRVSVMEGDEPDGSKQSKQKN
jgi:hypothetical protein